MTRTYVDDDGFMVVASDNDVYAPQNNHPIPAAPAATKPSEKLVVGDVVIVGGRPERIVAIRPYEDRTAPSIIGLAEFSRGAPAILWRNVSWSLAVAPDEIRSQRDELLALLKEVVPFLADHAEDMADFAAQCPSDPDGPGAARTATARVERVKAAIARAEAK